MSELKQCPFCGGNPELEENNIKGFWRIRCENEDCVAGANWCYYYDREKLVNAWNTRAERTCKMTSLMSVGRTDFVCDQCDHCTCYTKPNFCPTCGAKVVEP